MTKKEQNKTPATAVILRFPTERLARFGASSIRLDQLKTITKPDTQWRRFSMKFVLWPDE
jgi:hypothetical protein